jgi:hypothetical protein
MIYNIRLSFTDRKQGPGTGRSVTRTASTIRAAVSHAVGDFWSTLDRKQRNDVRTSGMKIEVHVVKQ